MLAEQASEEARSQACGLGVIKEESMKTTTKKASDFQIGETVR
jgi:hypothetical protein